jgi:hypothetical protein
MIAILALAADIAATLDLSDRTEVRARSLQQGGTVSGSGPGLSPLGVDVATLGDLRLRATDRRWDYSVAYSVSLIAPDIELGLTPQVLQLASVSATWHDRFVRIGVREDATYGLENSAYLVPTQLPAQTTTPGAPPPSLQAAPAPQTITLGSSRTTLTSGLMFDRRTRASASVEYVLSGGLDTASQAQLPFQTGPRASADFTYAVSRSDTVITAVTAQQSDFSVSACPPPAGPAASISLGGFSASTTCQLSDRIGQVTEGYRHKLSRSAGVSASAGAAVAAVRLHPQDTFGNSFYPIGEASFTDVLTRAGDTVTLFARYWPAVDIRTGLVLSSLQVESTLQEHITRLLALRFATGVAQSIPTDQPAAATILHGDVGVEYQADRSRWLALSLGERMYWQNQNGLGSFLSAFGYVAVTVRERTLHF